MELEDKLKLSIGKLLKQYRVLKNISQEKLALDSGIDRTYISLLEKGKRNITVKMLFLLCKTLEVKPSEFLNEIETSTVFEN